MADQKRLAKNTGTFDPILDQRRKHWPNILPTVDRYQSIEIQGMNCVRIGPSKAGPRVTGWLEGGDNLTGSSPRLHPSTRSDPYQSGFNVVLMLRQRLRRWPNIKTTLDQRFMFAEIPSPGHTRPWTDTDRVGIARAQPTWDVDLTVF